MFLGVLLWCGTARADSVWEVLPYRVHLVIALERGPDWPPQADSELGHELVARCDAVIGAVWDAAASAAPPVLGRKMLGDFEAVGLGDLPAGCLEFDKVMLVAVRGSGNGFEVAARELDVRTQVFGTTVRRPLWQPAKLRDVCLAAVAGAFCPLARIDQPKENAVVLRPRGVSLPRREGTPQWIGPGTVFRPIVRKNDREGKLSNLTYIPWTYLLVERAEPAQLDCRVYSGLRGPLSSRRRGRIEYLALAVVPPGRPTVVTIQSRAEADRPLAGYDVLAHAPGSRTPIPLGRSDSRGQIEIGPAETPLRLLVVASGGVPLARLPVVPGLEPRLVARVPNDDARMRAEGFVIGLQEQLVDLVTQREILLARARSRLEGGKTAEAAGLVEQLDALKRSRDLLEQELADRQKVSLSADPAVQAKIDALFADTKKLLAQQMDDSALHELTRRLVEAKSAPPPARE